MRESLSSLLILERSESTNTEDFGPPALKEKPEPRNSVTRSFLIFSMRFLKSIMNSSNIYFSSIINIAITHLFVIHQFNAFYLPIITRESQICGQLNFYTCYYRIYVSNLHVIQEKPETNMHIRL